MTTRLLCSLVASIGVGLFAVPIALADLRDEQALAERFAPVVRLVLQPVECGPGEPFEPTDVELLFDDEPTVALRGPWNRTDLVKVAPHATDLVDRYEYHLDFPGDPLDPGCSYEQWSRRLTAGSDPTVYAHVATEPDAPGKLSLQYWFFYPFNDFNNTHEGDWEMIQLVFDAADARDALGQDPFAGRVQLARGGGGGGLGRRQARADRRDASGRLPGSRLAREQVHRCALPRQLGGRRRRLRQHDRPTPRAATRRGDDRERAGSRGECVPLDLVRGAVG